MGELPTQERLQWQKPGLAFVPVIAFAVAAVIVGFDGVLGKLFLAGVFVGLLGQVTWFWPRQIAQQMGPDNFTLAEEEFLRGTTTYGSIDEVGDGLRRAVLKALGPVSSALLVPDPNEGVRMVASTDLDRQVLRDIVEEMALLPAGEALFSRDQLEGLAPTIHEVMVALELEHLMPLRQRQLLLGAVFLGQPLYSGTVEVRYFIESLRVYSIAAVANVILAAEVGGRKQARETLGLANSIQESLMPQELPVRFSHFELRGLFRPVAACGGDLWSWRMLSEHRVLLLVGDATGHGAAPALLSAVAKGCIDGYVQVSGAQLDPGKLLSAMNKIVFRVGKKRYLMSAFAAVVDVEKNTLDFSNAALNFPYLIGQGKLEPLVARGNPLGGADSVDFETQSRPFLPGTKLFLYTDGVVEAPTGRGSAFGERLLRQLLVANEATPAVQLPTKVLAAVEEALGEAEFEDDITIVAFEHGEQGERLDA